MENPKPHPEPIQKALKALPNGAKTIWMVGDTCMDMLSAKEANVIGVGVTCGYADEVNLINCTDYIHSNALEAVRFIANR